MAQLPKPSRGPFTTSPAVEVAEGNLLDLNCDAIVSPANSFGDMSGGIDKSIDDFHHGAAQRSIMAAIAEHFLGELPVGMALIVEIPGRRFPFVVAAPTMRVPSRVTDSLNAYLAMRAALVAVLRHNADGLAPSAASLSPAFVRELGAWPRKMPPSRCALLMIISSDNARAISATRHWPRSPSDADAWAAVATRRLTRVNLSRSLAIRAILGFRLSDVATARDLYRGSQGLYRVLLTDERSPARCRSA